MVAKAKHNPKYQSLISNVIRRSLGNPPTKP